LGPVKIAGNVKSADGNGSGKIDSHGKLAGLNVGGSVIGGMGRQNTDLSHVGQIHSDGHMVMSSSKGP